METRKFIVLLLFAVFGTSLISCESTNINEETVELERLETQLDGKKEIKEPQALSKSGLQKVVDVRGSG
ncbi:hypothetical protein [uncultured Aquimarina sp.]|uniref:hypothetical protein n=1 Tax=uncultured Aquimarina sp. TaxID=575652 RepID=UPI002602EAED|nr:hypothetical protein [uncultured Aquimarina sp.]